jgi:hypothetical protein
MSNLPPGVTDAMIEDAQGGEPAEPPVEFISESGSREGVFPAVVAFLCIIWVWGVVCGGFFVAWWR